MLNFKFNITKEAGWKIAKTGCKVVMLVASGILPVLESMGSNKKSSHRNAVTHIHISSSDYARTVQAIADSNDLWSSDKTKVISLLPKDADESVYDSILAIVKSDGLWSSDKRKLIEKICES